VDCPNLPEESLYWGDTIQCSPNDLHRVYFQNLDGLRNDNEEIDLYVESMLHYQVGTFCWTDPCLDFLQPAAKSKIHSHTRAHFKTARTAFSTSTIPNEGNSLYKPGGTLTTTTGKWTTRCVGKPITDTSGMGRWSGLSVHLRQYYSIVHYRPSGIYCTWTIYWPDQSTGSIVL
jgi:hypothetical protein